MFEPSRQERCAGWYRLFPPLAVQTPVLDRFGQVVRLEGVLLGQVGNRAGHLKHPNKELLYVKHEFEEFVPRVVVGWEELATIGV